MSLFSTGLRIEELRPRPVLVFEHGNLCLPLPPLDHLNIGAHALLGVPLHKLMEREPVRVEAREGDELPDVAEPSELTGEGFDRRVVHPGRVPIERGGEVVREELAGKGRVDARGELLCLLDLEGVGGGGQGGRRGGVGGAEGGEVRDGVRDGVRGEVKGGRNGGSKGVWGRGVLTSGFAVSIHRRSAKGAHALARAIATLVPGLSA